MNFSIDTGIYYGKIAGLFIIENYSTIGAGIYNTGKAGLHIIENLTPTFNANLGPSNTELKPEIQKKIAHIKEIKDRICEEASIPSENIELRVQKKGIFNVYGNTNQAILGIGEEVLQTYSPTLNNPPLPIKPTILPSRVKIKLQRFLSNLPNNISELKEQVNQLTSNEKTDFYPCLKRDLYNFSDEELRFILSHEIIGHIKSGDRIREGIYSTVFGLTGYITSLVAENYLPIFKGSGFLYQIGFYYVSRIALQSLIVKRSEINADIKALSKSQNISGGISLFKRLLVMELLKPKEENHSIHTTSCICYESVAKRLARCFEVQKKSLI